MALSTVTLRAVPGARVPAPLRDESVRGVVRATAQAIAERMGVPLVGVEASEDAIVATLDAPQVVAIGFAAELRRLTDAWHEERYGSPLWGEAP